MTVINVALNVKRYGFFLIRGAVCQGNQSNWRASDLPGALFTATLCAGGRAVIKENLC
jgi:hypothetical protein